MIRWPFAGRRERLRRQASDWIAKLNGPHDAGDRAAFTDWYRADTDNAAAYDRLSALFSTAEGIRPAIDLPSTKPPAAWRGNARPVSYGLATAAAVLIAFAAFAVLGPNNMASPSADGQTVLFAATGSEARRVVLLDGSEVVLSPGSELEVAIDSQERRLRLRRGEGRFTVAHESRPFAVAAQGAEVVARGTQFMVRLSDEGTLVSLIEGRVEVSFPANPGHARRRIAALVAGDRLLVPAAPMPSAESVSGVEMIEFDDTRLADAVDQMNRRANRPVRLADPALAGWRLTGAFRVGDAEAFARGAAAALGLEVERGSDGSLLLRASRQGASAG